ncbi:hypothetical protein [Arcobacter sp. LA11]|uniref:hypothetical protein n=1 Tax=Arcobacter sp. LA11 TaxID=1898176 RepID=UPI000933CB84|nr:hypothetical protein [Arcobacter sp. LA11]
MKKGIALILSSMFILVSVAFAEHHGEKKMMEKKMMKKEMMKKERPNNIDKNNVGITEAEQPDQTDPTLIEGNLENNDFKN